MDIIALVVKVVITLAAASFIGLVLFKKRSSLERSAKIGLSFALVAVLVVGGGVVALPYLQSDSEYVSDEQLYYEKNDFKLKHVSDISVTDTPNMYDFVNGSIGMNNPDIDMVTDNVYVFVTKDDSSRFYVAKKPKFEGSNSIKQLLPFFSSEPIGFFFETDEQIKDFVDTVSSEETTKKIEEDGFTFYVVDAGLIDADTHYHGFNVTWFNDNAQQGNMDKFANVNGHGYPTNIIRENCDLNAIKEAYGVDFNDDFWNSVNYGAQIKCYNTKNKDVYCVLTPSTVNLVAGSDVKINTFLVNGFNFNTDKDGVSSILTEAGYQTVDEAINYGAYATYDQVKSLEGKSIS